jgi:hypothetical protein
VDVGHSVDGVSEDLHCSRCGRSSSGEYLGVFYEGKVTVEVKS